MRFAPRILTSVAAAAIGGALLVSSQPPAALAVPPTNDNLSFAETISLGTFNVTGNNIDATLEGGEPPPSCQNNFSRSVWYRHTAAANAPLTASTEVSTFDTVLAVYSGPEVNPSLGDLVPVGCDDDGGAGTLSTLTFSAIAGVTYYFQAASFAGFSGILFVSFGQIPPNDNLAAALPAPPPHAATVNNVLATDESTEPGSCGVSHAVWYKADLAAGSYVARNLSSGPTDPVIAVYSGPSVSPTFPSLTLVGCNDDNDLSANSRLNFVAAAGTYYFQVGGLGSSEGNLTFTLNVIPDADGDGVADQSDNCLNTQNGPLQALVVGVGDQTDSDSDGVAGVQPPFGASWGGDACDADDDNDGIPDTADAFCRTLAEDYDGFEDGDGCPESDNDLDGILDATDQGKMCFDPAGTLACPIQTCRNLAEDYDAFKDSDGCPEPDNDNDGFADSADQCPGANLHTGIDGMLGSAQDLNHSGTRDGVELTLTSDDVFKWMFEDYDDVLDIDGCHDSPGEDFDSDGYTDDNEAGFPLCGNGKNDDNLDDAVIDDGCPNGPPPAGSFSEGQARIGTNAGYPCGITGWPSDTYSSGLSANKLDVQDIISFIAPDRRLDKSPPNTLYSARWDLAPGANVPFQSFISIFDITTMLNGTPGSPAYPPMLGGPRAFGKVCPFSP